MDNYVSREEFNNLKSEVKKLEAQMIESSKILQSIDKKIDVINEKLISADKMDELKLAPIEKRVSKIEDNQGWLWKTIGATLIGIAVKLIFDLSKLL